MWTAKFVENVKPEAGKRRRISCPSKSGLGMIISPLGKKTYIFRYSFNRIQKEIKIGDVNRLKLADARKAIIDLQEMLDGGKDPAYKTEKQIAAVDETIEGAVGRWLESEIRKRVKREHTYSSYRSLMNVHFVPFLGNRRLMEVSAADLEMRISDMLAADNDINSVKLVPRLKDFFKWAKKKYHLKSNPAIELETPAKRTKRDRNLSASEVLTFWKALKGAPKVYALPLEFLIRSAQRKSEVIYMPLSELRRDEQLWVINSDRTKNGREHAVPLTDRMLEIIDESLALTAARGIENPEYVFLGPNDKPMASYTLNYFVKETSEYFGLKEWWIHDLRRTANTQMAASGVVYEHRERVLNHSPGGLDAVYNLHDYLQEKYDALHLLDRRMNLLFSGKKEAGNVVAFKKA